MMEENKQKIRDLVEHITTITYLVMPKSDKYTVEAYQKCCEDWNKQLETYLEGL